MGEKKGFDYLLLKKEKALLWCEWNFNSLSHKCDPYLVICRCDIIIKKCYCIELVNSMYLTLDPSLAPSYQPSSYSVSKCKADPILRKNNDGGIMDFIKKGTYE